MPSRADLRKPAWARMRDAETLLRSRRYHGAFYLCGYAVEMALKARICATLRWEGIPETRSKGYESVMVHDFDVLAKYTGREQALKPTAEWNMVRKWRPEVRYHSGWGGRRDEVVRMIRSAEAILRML